MISRLSRRFAYVPGFFEHDRQTVGPEQGFRAETLPGLGLLERSYGDHEGVVYTELEETQWQRFAAHLEHLNSTAGNGVTYKLFYLVRHGEGEHNVKEREVGREQWETKWAHLDGDSQRTWADAPLTAKGISQALALNSFWKSATSSLHVPLPEKIFSSPLRRCLQTTSYMFQDIARSPVMGQSTSPFIVTDAIRETSGRHTCDRRRSRSEILTDWPQLRFLEPFSEADELWRRDRRETMEEVKVRVEDFLQSVFQDDEASPTSFVVVTAHSGTIRGFYQATGHPDVWVAAGAMVPVLVKGEVLKG